MHKYIMCIYIYIYVYIYIHTYYMGAGQAVAGQVNNHQAVPRPSSRLLLTCYSLL